MTGPEWIAIDWGTTALRAWAVSADGAILGRAASPLGMSSLEPGGFEPALLEVVGPWLPPSGGRCAILGCGMVGSRQGWIEVPYRDAPCRPWGKPVAAPVSDRRMRVLLCPGVKQECPADVMRGEETQVAGLLATRPDFDGVVCLPGTHCKWVHVSGGKIRSFATFLTGELFGLLARDSVLRFSVADEGWDPGDFLDAVAAALAAPESVAGLLFSIRADWLLHGSGGATGRSRLSGYLIGVELAATRAHWERGKVAIIGAPEPAGAYARALCEFGAGAESHCAETMTLAGLQAAYRHLA